MRRARLASLVLTAALAGCSVDLEGARCHVAGATEDCPSGQACGTGLTCSVRAAQCAPCTAGAKACKAGDKDVWECTADGDPACGTLKPAAVTACVTGVQTCKVPVAGGDPVCACLRHVVDAGGGTCTHPSIASAIAAAVAFPAPVVVLGGAAPATYGADAADVAPIILPAGVSLIGDETAPTMVPLNRIIEVHGAGAAALVVEAGASVRGLTVRKFAAGGPPVGLLVDGASPAGGNSLASVLVDAGGTGGAFATGLRVGNAGAVAVSDVQVKGATGAGLEVNRLAATDVVVVTGSTFDQNGVGVSLLKGDLTLQGTTVKRSVGEGVTSVSGGAALTVQDGIIAGNGATGVVITAVQKLVLERTRICGNTGVDKLYGGQTRKVGGFYSQGPRPPQLTFSGNKIHGNTGDQMYLVASSTTWDVSGPGGCTSGVPNVFAGYSAPNVGLAALAANVNAVNNAWETSFPTTWDPLLPSVRGDYFVSGTCGAGPCQIDVGTGSGNVCLPVPLAELTCPTP